MGQGDLSPLQQIIVWNSKATLSTGGWDHPSPLQHAAHLPEPLSLQRDPFFQISNDLCTLVQTSNPKSRDTYVEQQGRRGTLTAALVWSMWWEFDSHVKTAVQNNEDGLGRDP